MGPEASLQPPKGIARKQGPHLSNPRGQEAGRLQPTLYILAPENHKTQTSLQKHKYNRSGPGSEGIPEAGLPSDYPETRHEEGDQFPLWPLLLIPFISGPSGPGAHAMNLEPPSAHLKSTGATVLRTLRAVVPAACDYAFVNMVSKTIFPSAPKPRSCMSQQGLLGPLSSQKAYDRQVQALCMLLE